MLSGAGAVEHLGGWVVAWVRASGDHLAVRPAATRDAGAERVSCLEFDAPAGWQCLDLRGWPVSTHDSQARSFFKPPFWPTCTLCIDVYSNVHQQGHFRERANHEQRQCRGRLIVTAGLTDTERARLRQAIRAVTGHDPYCDTEVSRRGECEPCGKAPAAIAVDDEWGSRDFWPVCAHHARAGWCVPLREVIAVALEDKP